MKKLILVVAGLLCWLGIANASALTVVADYGGTELADLFRGEGPATEQSQQKMTAAAYTKFPVVSSFIKSRRVHQFKYSQHQLSLVTNDIFLVGSEPLSKRWLQINATKLKELGAKGIFVHGTRTDYRAMRQIYPDLSPMSGDGFSVLTHYYPVLITRHGLFQ